MTSEVTRQCGSAPESREGQGLEKRTEADVQRTQHLAPSGVREERSLSAALAGSGETGRAGPWPRVRLPGYLWKRVSSLDFRNANKSKDIGVGRFKVDDSSAFITKWYRDKNFYHLRELK